MFIESLELNGWKTYFKPITITGFDKSFNAISGRNGSGKSNILDAVQFVLGSSNKELLRLKSSLIQLIYKDGQAGILEAAVTLKLKIPNRNLRPFGYQSNQTLSITRTIHKDKGSKFFLEGKTIPAGRLKTLLQSMHLSVQHSQFIVKQGQITKLAASKPHQILQMVEDAIGTSSYVNSRNDTLDILKKTDNKIKQINFALTNTITPFMDQIKSERALLNVLSLKQKQLQELRQRVFPYQYLITLNKLEKLTHTLEESRRTISSNEIQIQNLKERLKQAQKLKGDYSDAIQQVRILKLKLTDAQNEVISKTNEFNHVNRRLQSLRIEFKQGEEQIDELKHRSQRAKKKYLQHQQGFAIINDQINENKRKLQQLNNNTTNSDMTSFIDKQILQFEGHIKKLKLQIDQFSAKQKAISKDLDNFKNTKRDGQSRAAKRLTDIEKITKQIQELKKLEAPVEAQNPDAPEFNERRTQLIQQLNNMTQATPNLLLRYMNEPPVPNFNKDDVKGKVFNCFKLKKQQHFKAIQIGAGTGKLNNIVVRNQVTSSILINYGCFGQFVSIIPNNKITFRTVSQDITNNMQRIAEQHKGMAKVAYDLITYDKQIDPTMKFVFGTFAVVSSKQIGKAIAYNSHPSLRFKCVTLQGEVFDPSGTLSGGYYNMNNFILNKVSAYRTIQQQLKTINDKKEALRKQYLVYKQHRDRFDRSKNQLNFKVRELQKLQQQGRQLKTQQLNVEDLIEQLQSMKASKKNLNDEIQVFKGKIQKNKGMKNNKDGKNVVNDQKKLIQQEINKKQQDLSQMKKQGSKLFKQMQQISYKLKNCERVLNSSKQIQKLQNQLIKIQEELQGLKKNQKTRQWQLQEKMSRNDQDKIVGIIQQTKNNQNKVQRLKTENVKFNQDNIEIGRQLIELEEQRVTILTKNNWIETFISQKNITLESYSNDYNFESEKKKYTSASGSLETMENKVSNLADKDTSFIENEYQSLLKKLDILSNDKQSLLKSIKDLDEKRITSIERSYEMIRTNLKKIFTNLYTVATCDLIPFDRSDILKGFQITFSLGQTQKFLIQLSGGQKSLLSLSFIFSLLLFRPCPFYFLDEIDAALDEVHTQNLGRMIRQHFPQSQFIIISLKQTMFRNANVLFNVSFVQNTSIVDRITKQDLDRVQMKTLFSNNEQDQNQNNNNEGKKKNVKKPNKYAR